MTLLAKPAGRRESDPPLCQDHDWDDMVLPACKRCFEPMELGWQVKSRVIAQGIAMDQARARYGS